MSHGGFQVYAVGRNSKPIHKGRLPMSEKFKKVDLTVYLSKDEFDTVETVVKPNAAYSTVFVNTEDGELGWLFIMKSRSNPPRWASLFSEDISLDQIGRNQSTGALLVVKDKGRLFLISFGQGRHLLRAGCVETNFGLRVALNILHPESIRSLDKSSLEAQPKQAREQSGEAVGLQFFGVDIERDLLRAITGKPKNVLFGQRISGGDPLKLSVEIQLKDIRELLRNIYAAYIDDSYKIGPFAWIDHISEIKDKLLREKLDEQLVEKLNIRNFDHTWLCAPSIIDWDRVVGFKYSTGKNAMRYHDTRIHECLDEIDKKGVDIAVLKRRIISAVDEDDHCVFEDTVYRFIYTEICSDGLAHLLNAGKWYAVSSDYVQRIQEQYETILSKHYERNLLEYDDETEAAYNVRLAGSDTSEFALLDKNNIYLPDAASPIEPCDLYRKEKELIHVKRYGGSSVLSHMFNQGLVSGELLQSEINFRKMFNEKLPQHLRIEGIEKMPERQEFTVVYAIISEQEQGLSVPFFSKISMKHAVNRLEAFGFNVKLAKIPVSDQKKKTKICPPA